MSDEDDDFEVRKTAWIAFKSSAIAGFKPQQAKYKSAQMYAEEVDEFSNACADEAMRSYLERAKDGFEFEDEEEEEEVVDDDEEERPRRRARR